MSTTETNGEMQKVFYRGKIWNVIYFTGEWYLLKRHYYGTRYVHKSNVMLL